ncbi:MAG: hypothetical protein H7X95_01420 [Deltaproteobacteria bacterium]|nr:hypothetical protein [Deltaproteobacteria bacterium]
MKLWRVSLLFLSATLPVACGGGGASTRRDAAPDVPVTGPDAPRDLLPDVARDVSPASAVGVLSGLRWELPCSNNFNGYCDTPLVREKSATLIGAPGVTYEIALRFRGVVEEKTYEGGTKDGHWNVGGAPADDLYNVYKMDVSNPPQTFFLNSGASNSGFCVGLDYTRTVRMAADSTVTLIADPIDGAQVENGGTDGLPVVVPGIPPAPSRYDGQFIQMDVVSVTQLP